MMQITVSALAKQLGYAYHEAQPNRIQSVVTDSRMVVEGTLFLAIVGERMDGHQYIESALEKGAAGVVITNPNFKNDAYNYIFVEDMLLFLAKLGNWCRRQLSGPVVGITGSMGKTSTRDLLTAILEQRNTVVSAKKNHNNEIGLPLTLTEINESTEVAVVELGMRGLGQIDELCKIAEPTHGIITNIGTVHCELLGSRENIAQAKAELLPYIPETGTVALNTADRHFLDSWLQTCKGRVLWYGTEVGIGDLWAEDITETSDAIRYTVCWGDERQAVELRMVGRHQVSNSLAAIAIAKTLGCDWDEIRAGLQNISPTEMRLEKKTDAKGVLWINDAYNANPDSMKAAIHVLQQQTGKRKIAVLGDMYELGQYETEGHKSVGVAAVEANIDVICAVGTLGKQIAEGAKTKSTTATIHWVPDNNGAIALLTPLLQVGDVVLVKGSRGMKMEQIVQYFLG